jgi:hypothetical protein
MRLFFPPHTVHGHFLLSQNVGSVIFCKWTFSSPINMSFINNFVSLINIFVSCRIYQRFVILTDVTVGWSLRANRKINTHWLDIWYFSLRTVITLMLRWNSTLYSHNGWLLCVHLSWFNCRLLVVCALAGVLFQICLNIV